MGLVYKKVVSEHALLGLWKIEESEEDMLHILETAGISTSKALKKRNTKRIRESLATRCLLFEMLEKPFEIGHDADGKPFLQGDTHQISISHFDQYATIYLSTACAVGIDVQKIKFDIAKGIGFFLNVQEQIWVDKMDFILINILWSAKESIFKYAADKDLNIKDQITIYPFRADSEGIIEISFGAQIDQKVSVSYEIFEDYILTRTL